MMFGEMFSFKIKINQYVHAQVSCYEFADQFAYWKSALTIGLGNSQILVLLKIYFLIPNN